MNVVSAEVQRKKGRCLFIVDDLRHCVCNTSLTCIHIRFVARRPLFKPCICSGSIGLTHQDCLQSWLQVQRGDGSCELCKTKFRFSPLYAPNAPARLSVHAVISRLIRRAIARWLPLTLRSLFAASLWLVVAPLATAYLYHGWMARPSVILQRMLSQQTIVTDLISGGVVASCIIVSFLSLMSFADFLRLEWQQRGGFAPPLPRAGLPVATADHAIDDTDIDDGIYNLVQQQLAHRRTTRGSRGQELRLMGHWDGAEKECDSFVSSSEHDFETSQLNIDRIFEDEDNDDDSECDDDSDYVDSWDTTVYDDDDEEYRESSSDEEYEPPIALNAQEVRAVVEQEDRPENQGLLPVRRRQPGQRNDAFDMLDADEPGDMDINIALDELLGIRGPLLVVGRNLIWLLAFNGVYLGFFAFVPRTIGIAMGSILFNTTAFTTVPMADNENMTNATSSFNNTESFSLVSILKAVDAESLRHNTAFRLHDIATITLGYFSIAFAIVLFRLLWLLSGKIRSLRSGIENREDHANPVDFFEALRVQGLGNEGPPLGDQPDVAVGLALGVALDVTVAIVKVGALLFLKMFMLPILLGIALDASTMPLFGNTLADRILYAGQDIFSFVLLHWVTGITFMLLVTVSVLQLREVAHPDLLAQMIRPQEPHPDLLGNLMHESIGTHSKRMVLSLIIYAFLLAIQIYLPVRWVICKLIDHRKQNYLQLKFYYMLSPQLQVPIELLFFHLCMLALLEKYKNGLGGMQHQWLKFMSKIMGLSDRLLPQKVSYFTYVGTCPVFKSVRVIDPFLYDVADGKKDAIASLKSHFLIANDDLFSRGETKPDGSRVLSRCARFIRLPGKENPSESVLLPSKIGMYHLKRDKWSKVIELWEELPGEPIVRPPEGWDDLGVGGADVQGRWAWGAEKKSRIENGVAARRPFFDKEQSFSEALSVLLKLLCLVFMSWLAASTVLCVVAATPLVIGRTVYRMLRIPNQWVHDPLAYGFGFTIMFPFIRKMAKVIASSDLPMHLRLRRWIYRYRAPPLHKAWVLFVTAVLWFGMAPLLLGFCYDLAFIKPVEWFAGAGPLCDWNSSLWSWMSGSVLFYVWADLCILGVLTRNYRVFVLDGAAVHPENVDAEANDAAAVNRGVSSWQGKHGRMARFWGTWRSIVLGWEWDQVDEVLLLHECAAPVVCELMYTLIYPILAHGLCLYRFPFLSASARMLFVRLVFAVTCCIRVGRAWKEQLRSFFDVAHKTARDDLYLIGEILLNFRDT
jgi:E3 ubiquitin-protein ligase MARCH6